MYAGTLSHSLSLFLSLSLPLAAAADFPILIAGKEMTKKRLNNTRYGEAETARMHIII